VLISENWSNQRYGKKLGLCVRCMTIRKVPQTCSVYIERACVVSWEGLETDSHHPKWRPEVNFTNIFSQLLRLYSCDSLTVGTKKLQKTLSNKKAARRMLVKLTPDWKEKRKRNFFSKSLWTQFFVRSFVIIFTWDILRWRLCRAREKSYTESESDLLTSLFERHWDKPL